MSSSLSARTACSESCPTDTISADKEQVHIAGARQSDQPGFFYFDCRERSVGLTLLQEKPQAFCHNGLRLLGEIDLILYQFAVPSDWNKADFNQHGAGISVLRRT